MAIYPTPDFEKKILSAATLSTRIAGLPRPLVFTNGCFDILHRGHVTYLAQARSLGASLIVAVNSDSSVKRLGKGANRPLNNEHDRTAVLAALASVDAVILFDEDTPLNLILAIQPEVLVKGGDWAPAAMVGSQQVLAAGGSVHSIPFLFNTSTTAMVEKIKTQG